MHVTTVQHQCKLFVQA